MPSRTVLPVVLEEIARTPGVEIVILVATGTHRLDIHTPEYSSVKSTVQTTE